MFRRGSTNEKEMDNRFKAIEDRSKDPNRIPLPSKCLAKETMRLWNYDICGANAVRYDHSGCHEPVSQQYGESTGLTSAVC